MKRPEQELFESARHVPVELSQAQVAGIIKGLVLLPVPPPPPTSFNWLHFLTSKPIIMNSLIISLVVSSLVFFQQVEEELPAPVLDQLEERAIIELEETEVLSPALMPIDQTPEETSSDKQHVPLQPTPAISIEEEVLAKSPLLKEPKRDTDTLWSTLSFLPQLSQRPSLPATHVLTPVLAPVDSYTPRTKEEKEQTDVFHSSNTMRIKAGRLKKQLLNQLTKDGLIADKKSGVKMEIFEDRLILNGRELARAYEAPYRKILNKHNIKSGLYRQIRISPTFIIVGNFAPDGFRGMMHGAVNTDTLEGFEPIQSEGGLLSISGSSSERLFPIDEEDPLVGIARIGSTTTIFPSMASGPYLMEDGVISSDPITGVPQIATSIFPTEGVDPIEGLGGDGPIIQDRWLSLKEELLINLSRDGLIGGASSPVLLAHTKRQISINGDRLDGRLLEKYRMILLKYGISSGPKTEIHITPDYIMGGEFDKNGHMVKGHASGKVKLHDKTDRIIGLKIY